MPLLALLAACGISSFGSSMTLIAIPWFVLQSTGSGAKTGLVAAAETIGMLLSVALAGPLIDRFGAYRASVVADLTTAVVVVAIPLSYATSGLPLPLLVVLSFAIGAGRAPSRSAKQVLLPHVIARTGTSVERGTSGEEAMLQGGDLLGTPVGGLLIALTGPTQTLLVDAIALCSAAFLVLLLCRPGKVDVTPDQVEAEPGKRNYLDDLRTGVRHLLRDRLLVALGGVSAVSNALGIALVSVFLPAYGVTVWHSSLMVGFLIAAASAGSIVGTVLYGWRGAGVGRRRLFAGGLLLSGAPIYLVVALNPPPAVLVLLVFLLFTGNGPINPVLAAVKYDRVPERMRGTVFGAFNTITSIAMPLGLVFGGVLLDGVGLTAATLSAGAASLLITLCPAVFPIWRQMAKAPEQASTVG
ncbi:MFS transporter [Actinosynnema sp. NPDC020468]|uniref:MFS transporter n=1 Tax=Actinosynnema sp. NPDC020468 TaxID=3154488 RepID=UPI0033C3980E